MSMIKTIHSSVIPDGVGACSRLIEDPVKFIKAAADTKAVFDYEKLKPDADHVGVHSVALGDGETYGNNRNGDCFTKAACRKYHDTFVKQGNVFAHHMHDSKDKAIGKIAASVYNEPMGRIELFLHVNKKKASAFLEKWASDGEISGSMSCRVPVDRCFEKGTYVLTPKGVMSIESIRVGDLVITHTGTASAVTHTHKNKYTGDMVIIKAANTPPVRMTANHPMLYVPAAVMRSKAGRQYAFERPEDRLAVYFNKELGAMLDHVKQAQASALRVGDYLFNPGLTVTSNDATSGLSTDLAYLCGSYAGDGSLIKERRGRAGKGEQYVTGVAWTCNETDDNIVKLLLSLHAVSGIEPKIKYEPNKHACTVRITDRRLAGIVRSCCGEYSTSKTACINLLTTREARLAFLAGLLDTDGCKDSKKGTVRITTTSDQLMYAAWQLCLMCGISAALRKESRTGSGFKRNKDYCWVLYIGVAYASPLEEYSVKMAKTKIERWLKSDAVFYDGRWLTPIKDVSVEQVTDLTVYNLSVAGDETYIAGGLATHNCTICNNIRKNAKDPNECEHVKNALGKLMDDGRAVGTWNDDPTFFDYSFVTKPADRIAWSLNKAASAITDFTKISSAALAEMENIYVPEEVVLDSRSALSKYGIGKKLAEYEKRYRAISEAGPHNHEDRVLWELRKSACEQALPDEAITVLRNYEPSDVMYALAKEKILLDPVSYVKYAMGVDMGSLAEHIQDIKKACSGMCARLLDAGDMYDVCNESTYDVEDFFRFSTAACKIASECRRQGSLDANFAGERAVLNTIEGHPAEMPFVKNSSENRNSPLAECVARKYISYKLAAADAMQAMDRNINEQHYALMAARSLVKTI